MKIKLFYVVTLLTFSALAQINAQQAGVQTTYCYLEEDGTCVLKKNCQYAACNCDGKHPVFNIPTNKTPKKIPFLGTNPQFGTLKNLKTETEVFEHLKNQYRTNRSNANELDRLWKAMGYTGFTDPAFSDAKISQEILPAGVTGMLGAGGHSYVYSTISEGQDISLVAYRIKAVSACDIYIMETCGNAFFTGCSGVTNCETIRCNKVAGAERSANNVSYAFMRNDSCIVDICRRISFGGENFKNNHPVYNIPVNTEAKVIPRLGSNPQFGTLVGLNAEQAYNRLKQVYRTNSGGDAGELDRLWKAMGYTGFTDPTFTVDRVSEVFFSPGTTGVLGAGGHSYVYATIAPNTTEMLRGFKITAPTNCDITIMEICGNAYFTGCETLVECREVPCGCNAR